MSSRILSWFLAIGVLVVILCVALFFVLGEDPEQETQAGSRDATTVSGEPIADSKSKMPPADGVESVNPNEGAQAGAASISHPKSSTETVPGAKKKTIFASPEPFDQQAYLADPPKYLKRIDPRRIDQYLEPAANVPKLKVAGEKYHEMLQGESVMLRTQGEPFMPVTFFSRRFGQFENRLRTITVAANASGNAETRFTATTGTHGIVDLFAASPVSSGKIRFRLKVIVPKKTTGEK